ncbi:MAG: amidohydrolase family protein [Hellea sp.]|nr:amidohydrolase family protein [Hellea sp.]
MKSFAAVPMLMAASALIGCSNLAQHRDHSRIIDVHRHGSWPESDDTADRHKILSDMGDHGVRISVISLTDYDDIENWVDEAPDALIAGVMIPCPKNVSPPHYKCFPSTSGWVDLNWLRAQIEAGKIQAIHEVLPNYYGIAASDPKFDPYFALAHEFDLPVGVHTQRGPPPEAVNSIRSEPGCCPDYDGEMGNPALLRSVLDKYPGLRIWIQHVGAGNRSDHRPYWDETLALLRDYAQVNLDLSITNGALPIAHYDTSLRRLFDAGFGDRIMFGSDGVPTALILERLNSINWLSRDQRDAILYKNAEKFFKLND